MAALYAVEKDPRPQPGAVSRVSRKACPLANALEAWLRAKLAVVSQKIKLVALSDTLSQR